MQAPRCQGMRSAPLIGLILVEARRAGIEAGALEGFCTGDGCVDATLQAAEQYQQVENLIFLLGKQVAQAQPGGNRTFDRDQRDLTRAVGVGEAGFADDAGYSPSPSTGSAKLPMARASLGEISVWVYTVSLSP